MPTTNVTIRMDAELKKQAEKLLGELGMNMTTALEISRRPISRNSS